MELPDELYGAVVSEGSEYFFTADCPVGVHDHIHICIKKKNKYLLFSTCSSQIETAFRLAKMKGYDMNTFPVFKKDENNRLNQDLTYVNCNHVVEISESTFGKLVKDGKIYRMKGVFTACDLQLIANGVKLSREVERRIKDLF